MAKYKVLLNYTDKYTKEKVISGSIIELTEKRAKEINTGKNRVSKIEEEVKETETTEVVEVKASKKKKKVEKNED